MAKIVCIEDERGIREDIAEALEMQGHDIIEAENGEKGLEAILREKPDLALSDITMPVMDGHGLLTTIRSQHPEFADMPFVFLTALADRKDQISGRELGADEYLTKPVDFDLMHVVVKAKLRQVERMRENKERQLLKMYGALTNIPVLDDESQARTPLNGVRLNIVSLASGEMDLAAAHHAIRSHGHQLHSLQSGRKFLETVGALAPDLLLISFNTDDLQAPMLIKMLEMRGGCAFPKILLLPPSVPDFPAMGKLPSFDMHLRAPVDCQALMREINRHSLHLKYSEDLLATG